MTTIDNVYAQRNELAVAFAKAALAAGWKAGRGIDSKADPEWANVVYVDLPDGRQVSWHMSPDCVPLLDGLPQYAGTWDGTFIGREAGWSRGIEAVAQQAEPTRSQQMVAAGFKPRDRRLECDECGGKFTAQMLPIHKCAQQKDPTDPGNDVDALREHVRHLERRIRELHAQQAEPLNLSDPAVRKRLASQWGYVHEAQQAEPHATAAELRRLRHNNQVLTDALWKACGDNEEAVNSTIASQGELK